MGDDVLETRVTTTGKGGITKENARAMVARRWEIAREKAAEGMAAAVEEIVDKLETGKPVHPAHIPTDAWFHVMKRATERFMKSDSIRGMSEMGNFIGKNTGMIHEVTKEDREGDNLPFYGLEDAKVFMQVINYYNSDYKDERDAVNIIDAEVNELINES
jgi:hypothetical protein